MREKIRKILYKDVTDMRERLFRLILVVGIGVSVVAIIAGFFLEDFLTNTLPICVLLAVILIASLLTFKYHKADIASMLFATVVICGVFPFTFFSSGGIDGGASIWFVLGLLYIFIMFRGAKLLVFSILAAVTDIATYVFAYYNPQLIVSLGAKSNIYFDSLFSVITVGTAVGVIMLFQLRAYEEEQRRTLRQKDEIENMSKSKEAFFANMSHEIRTPINTIIGLNEMILREDVSDEVAEDALKVKNASKILLALINDILDFSQIESDRMAIVPVTYKTRELFEDIVGLMQVRMNEKNLQFHVNIDSDLPTAMKGDETRLKQILINLLTNAVKYTPQGTVTLDVRGEMPEEGRARLTISVTDTGIGIKKEDLESLYDTFKRIDLENNRKIEGSGLGLAITKQLTSLMGGTITVDSIYKKGSVFTVNLEQPVMDPTPIGNVDYLQQFQARERSHYKQSFEAPMAKILVVDDNETNLMVITKLLRATKVQVDTARSGEECLSMMEKKVYHTILLDSMMPGMDGEQTLKAIRRRESMGRPTPVIAVTANASAADKQRYLEMGFDGYLAKPIEGELLEAEILKFLPDAMIEYRAGTEGSKRTAAQTLLRRKRKKIQITTDCVSDLSREYIEENDIKVIYSYIETENGIFRDTIEMDADNLARHLSNPGSRALAVSAPVGEYETFYAEALADAEDVIHISMASGAGKSQHNAAQAARGFDHVHVVNAGHISCGEGLLVLAASRLLHNGCNQVGALLDEIETLKGLLETTFIIPDIESFYESGHVGRGAKIVCDMFHLHPVVQMRQNDVRLSGFRTGNLDKAKKRLLRKLLRKKKKIDPRVVFVTHAGCTVKQQQEFVDEILRCISFEKVILEKASVSNSSNGGLGTMGLSYLTKVNGKVYEKFEEAK